VRTLSLTWIVMTCSLAAGCGGSSSRASLAASATAAATSSVAPLGSSSSGPVATSTAPAPPTIASVSPASIWNDEPAVLTILGGGYTATTAVELVEAGGTVVSAAQVSLRSSGELAATFAPGLTPGPRQLRLREGPAKTAGPTIAVVGNVDPDARGAQQVGWIDVQLQGASGDRPAMRVYYPALASGAGRPVDRARAPYPVVAYGHGFKPPLLSFGIDHRNNAFVAEWLASFGYIVACPDLATNNQLVGAGATGQANSGRDADDLIATLDDLARRGRDPQDPLFGLVDEARAALGGHSRGGDGALIAAAREATRSPRRVRAAFAFGPPATDSRNGNAPLVFGDLATVPLLLIGASRDAIAPVADQRAILARTNARGVVLEVVGGSHSLYKDNDTVILGDGTAVVPLATQHAVVRRHATAWLNHTVRGQGQLARPWLPGGTIAASDPRARLIDDTR
jgi:dienelactone hydrolase